MDDHLTSRLLGYRVIEDKHVPKGQVFLLNQNTIVLQNVGLLKGVKRMNRALIVLSLAAVTFVQGFLGALVAGGLTDLDVSTLQAAAVGAVGGALSVIVNGVGKLHAYLAARANL